MPKINANLTLLFTEHGWMDRFAAAADAGFRGVQANYPEELPAESVAKALRAANIEQVLMSLRFNSRKPDERGVAGLPGRQEQFRAEFEQLLNYARTLGCPRLHILGGNIMPGQDRASHEAILVENLRWAADRAAPHGVTLCLESLDVEHAPEYLFQTTGQVIAVMDRVGRDNVKLQLDLHHVQIGEGDLIGHVRRLAGRYAHIEIAGHPGRHEPDIGEINYAFLLDQIDAMGYDGWVAAEYVPANGTLAGLGWAKRWGIGK